MTTSSTRAFLVLLASNLIHVIHMLRTALLPYTGQDEFHPLECKEKGGKGRKKSLRCFVQ